MSLENTISLMKLLCTGCGACVAICPTNAISPTVDKGYFSIAIDKHKCVSCHICARSCPLLIYLLGKHIPRCFTPHARKTFLAWAADEKIRYRGASGGTITALLKHLLEKKVIDGVLIVQMKGVWPEAFIAKDVDEVLRAQGSIYFPTYSLKSVGHIMKTRGRYIIVGLPCQISSINVLVKRGVLKEDSIAYLFALRCHSVFAYWYLDYILSLLRLRRGEVIAVSSRGFGWPGRIFILSKRGTFQIPLIDGRLSLWNPLASTNLAAQLGCNICIDHEGFGADIVFGDAWFPDIIKKDSKGTSLIDVFSKRGLELIEEAVAAGVMKVQEVSIKTSQPPTSIENLAQKVTRMYIRKGIVNVFIRYGVKGVVLVFVYLLFYNKYSRGLLLKLPYNILMTIIDKVRFLTRLI